MNILAVKDLKMALPTGLGLAKLNGLLSVSQVRYFSCINQGTKLYLFILNNKR